MALREAAAACRAILRDRDSREEAFAALIADLKRIAAA
jgi:hypothetical protein